MTSSIVIDALRMAWLKRHPAKHTGLMFHSVRGSQYASGAFSGVLKEYGINSSTGRRGNCWVNAYSKTLFGSLKVERSHGNALRQGDRPKMKRWRGCFGITVPDCIQRWLTSVQCSLNKPGLQLNLGKPIHELGYGVRISGARSVIDA